MLTFTTIRAGRHAPLAVDTAQLIIAGWTGRDRAAVERHIDELRDIGVPPPSKVPLYYRAATQMAVQTDWIEVVGPDTSGEAEPVLVRADGMDWLGVGSDHTDRKAETHSIAKSKQLCLKPVSDELWLLDEVRGHWDLLELRSWATLDGERRIYQEGRLAIMTPAWETWASFDGPRLDRSVLFCGTVPTVSGIYCADRFEVELLDPVLKRTIGIRYGTTILPEVA